MSFYSDFAQYYDAVFPFEEKTYSFLRERFPSIAKRVLDVGCGTGDYCGRLTSQGYDTLGIDLDPWMIERAKRRYPAAEFRIMGMEDLGILTGTFEAAYSIGNVAAHIPRHRFQRLIWDLRERLTPESTWIMQTVNWDFVLSQGVYRFPDVRVEGTDVVFERSYPEVSEDQVTFRTRLLKEDSTIFEGDTTLYPIRAGDYVSDHEQSGFELIRHLGSFEGGAFDPGVMSSSILVFRRL